MAADRTFVEDEKARAVADAVLKAAGSGGLGMYTTQARERIVVATLRALREIKP